MSWQWACLVAAGGAVGSLVRGVLGALVKAEFPWATLLVNTMGALLVGFIMGRFGTMEPQTAMRWHALLVTGFCGGFTTFSAFTWQTLELFNRGQAWQALANVVLTLMLTALGVWVGFRLQ